MTTLAEVRESDKRDADNKVKVWKVGGLAEFVHAAEQAQIHRAFLLSLLDEIEALPNKWDCFTELRAIIKRQSE